MPVSQVTTKQVSTVRVIALRAEIESPREQHDLFTTLKELIAKQNTPRAGAGFAVHYNLDAVVDKQGKLDVEVCIPVQDDFVLPDHDGIKGLELRELPQVDRAASVTLNGLYTGLPDAYTALLAWVKENNETLSGATREIYHTIQTDPLSEDFHIEIVAPLA